MENWIPKDLNEFDDFRPIFMVLNLFKPINIKNKENNT